MERRQWIADYLWIHVVFFVLVILNCYENKISLYIYILFCVFIIYSLCIEIHLYLTFFYFQNKQLQQQKITDDYEWYTSDCEVALYYWFCIATINDISVFFFTLKQLQNMERVLLTNCHSLFKINFQTYRWLVLHLASLKVIIILSCAQTGLTTYGICLSRFGSIFFYQMMILYS